MRATSFDYARQHLGIVQDAIFGDSDDADVGAEAVGLFDLEELQGTVVEAGGFFGVTAEMNCP